MIIKSIQDKELTKKTEIISNVMHGERIIVHSNIEKSKICLTEFPSAYVRPTSITSSIETDEVFAHAGIPCTRKSRKVSGRISLETLK